MKISTEKPPNWNEIIKHFPVTWGGIIVTYGDTIYCGVPLSTQKAAHEAVHVMQQTSYGVDKWWIRYFEDIDFRLQQEVEAYRKEVQWVNKNVKDRNLKYKIIRKICLDLSSPIYGSIISIEEAKKILI